MSNNSVIPWQWLENQRSMLFSVGGGMFVVSTATVVAKMILGTNTPMGAEGSLLLLGQGFIAAGWVAALFGLLGLYPGLADRSKWLVRAGAVFAVIGVVDFTVMSVASFAYYLGIPDGNFGAIVPLLIPGVFIGSLLAFVSYSGAILRTDVYSKTVGVLLLGPPAIFVSNILTPGTDAPIVSLAINSGLVLVMLVIGYTLRTQRSQTDHEEAEPMTGPRAR